MLRAAGNKNTFQNKFRSPVQTTAASHHPHTAFIPIAFNIYVTTFGPGNTFTDKNVNVLCQTGSQEECEDCEWIQLAANRAL